MTRPAVLLLACACAAALFPPRAAAAPQLTPAGERQLDEGLKKLYSLDYDGSRAAFHRLIELEPESPFGYMFEAGGIWWQSSQEYGLFTDTPTLQGVFERDVDEALRKADAYIDSKDPQKLADGYFASGMTLGIRGQWRLMRRHWMNAYFDGKKAVKNLKRCLKQDPSYDDAMLGLGVFDYQAAHMTGIAKLGALFGMHGNEKRGLEEIRFAVDHARYSGRQAAQLLLTIAITDLRDDALALDLLRKLRADIPDSPYFLFVETLVRARRGEWDASLSLSRELGARIESDPAGFRPKWLTLVCGLSGSACLSERDARPSLEWVDRALTAAGAEKASGLKALLHLFRGQLLDVLGRRKEALEEYRLTLTLPDLDFVHARALECASAPCGRQDTLRSLRAWSKPRPETN